MYDLNVLTRAWDHSAQYLSKHCPRFTQRTRFTCGSILFYYVLTVIRKKFPHKISSEGTCHVPAKNCFTTLKMNHFCFSTQPRAFNNLWISQPPNLHLPHKSPINNTPTTSHHQVLTNVLFASTLQIICKNTTPKEHLFVENMPAGEMRHCTGI